MVLNLRDVNNVLYKKTSALHISGVKCISNVRIYNQKFSCFVQIYVVRFWVINATKITVLNLCLFLHATFRPIFRILQSKIRTLYEIFSGIERRRFWRKTTTLKYLQSNAWMSEKISGRNRSSLHGILPLRNGSLINGRTSWISQMVNLKFSFSVLKNYHPLKPTTFGSNLTGAVFFFFRIFLVIKNFIFIIIIIKHVKI